MFQEIKLYQIAKVSERVGQVTQAVLGFVLFSTTISLFMHFCHNVYEILCEVLVYELLNMMHTVVILAGLI